jgi:hypothetical protein
LFFLKLGDISSIMYRPWVVLFLSVHFLASLSLWRLRQAFKWISCKLVKEFLVSPRSIFTVFLCYPASPFSF